MMQNFALYFFISKISSSSICLLIFGSIYTSSSDRKCFSSFDITSFPVIIGFKVFNSFWSSAFWFCEDELSFDENSTIESCSSESSSSFRFIVSLLFKEEESWVVRVGEVVDECDGDKTIREECVDVDEFLRVFSDVEDVDIK